MVSQLLTAPWYDSRTSKRSTRRWKRRMALVRQQKLLSFTAGLALAGAAYVSTERFIWRSAANLADVSPNPPTPPERLPMAEPLFGAKEKAYMIRKWNQTVDGLFGPVVEGLSKRGL